MHFLLICLPLKAVRLYPKVIKKLLERHPLRQQIHDNYKGENVGGIHLHITDQDKVDLILIQFYFMQEHNKLYPSKNPFMGASKNQIEMFDKAVGNDTIRRTFEKNFTTKKTKNKLIISYLYRR